MELDNRFRVCLPAYAYRAGSTAIAIEAFTLCTLEKVHHVALLVFNLDRLGKSAGECHCLEAPCLEPRDIPRFLSDALDKVRGSMVRRSVKGFWKSKLHLLVPFLVRNLGVSSDYMVAMAILEKALSVVRGGEFLGVKVIPIEVECGEEVKVFSEVPEVERAFSYLATADSGVREFLKRVCREITSRTS